VSVELVFPDAAALEGIGINRMDASRRDKAAAGGVAQGRSLASHVAEGWAKAAAA
jgi:hypothetical protein